MGEIPVHCNAARMHANAQEYATEGEDGHQEERLAVASCKDTSYTAIRSQQPSESHSP